MERKGEGKEIRKKNKHTGNIFFAMFEVRFLHASKRSFFVASPSVTFCMKAEQIHLFGEMADRQAIRLPAISSLGTLFPNWNHRLQTGIREPW